MYYFTPSRSFRVSPATFFAHPYHHLYDGQTPPHPATRSRFDTINLMKMDYALLIGNGRRAAMVYSGPLREHLHLKEDTLTYGE